MQVTIGKIELGITNNGTVKAYIYPSGSDFTNICEAIEIIGDSAIYLATRKTGETVEITEKGQWKNINIPKQYLNALNDPMYERTKLLFSRSVSAFNKLANGPRQALDFDSAKVLITNNLELFLKTQDFILATLKKTNTNFAKKIVADIKSDNAETQFNAWKLINELTHKSINEINKDFKIINDCEEVKEEKEEKTPDKK